MEIVWSDSICDMVEEEDDDDIEREPCKEPCCGGYNSRKRERHIVSLELFELEFSESKAVRATFPKVHFRVMVVVTFIINGLVCDKWRDESSSDEGPVGKCSNYTHIRRPSQNELHQGQR